jgi:PAS domain S-box-containing protein
MSYPVPHNEALRLQALFDLKVLDTPADSGLDTLISMAKRLFNVPISLISLIDENRQWFKARNGLAVCETAREHAFCAHTIMNDDIFVVEDATRDARFRQNPLVTGEPNIRAYAGAPIILEPGVRVGTICIIDMRPRRFSKYDLMFLRDLADLIVGRLKLLRIALEADERAHLLTEANRLTTRAQVVLGVMSDGVVVQDKTGAIVSANDSACSVLGLSMDQMMGRTSVDPRWRSVKEDGSDLPGESHPAMVTLATGLPINDVTIGIEQPDRARRWLRVSSRPLFEDDSAQPSHAVATFSDITEIIEKGKALQRAHEVADAANAAKSAFLANVSHEIRTPLNAVIGLTSVLSQSSLNASQREMVELVKTSGDTLERLLSDILDVSKIEAGKLELCLAPMDLHATVTAAAQLIGLRADEKGIGFEVNFGQGTQGTFLGDAIRLRQIISNLASNALKFTQSGKVTVAVELDTNHNGRASDTWLKFVVTDTGRGFNEDTAKRLFTRFEQADTSITRAFGGTGLGLSICKSLTEMMGGTIQATSVPDFGSTFSFTVPLQKVDATKSLSRLASTSPLSEVTDFEEDDTPLRVLMAEDHPINQRVTSLCLAPLNPEITISQNGREAVDTFVSATFDIILMDMQMPEMDGLEATRLIRQYEADNKLPRTPIAMLSANAMPEHVQAALDAGCDNHIAKPITPASLYDGIQEAMKLAHLWPLNQADIVPTRAAGRN